LGAAGDLHLTNFIAFVRGCVIDLTDSPSFVRVLGEVYDIISHFPINKWKRINKISLADPNGGQIEYTSSSADSIRAWIRPFHKKCNSGTQLPILLHHSEKHISESISQFAFHSNGHVVCHQPGAPRSAPATVPQIAHRDFTFSMYHDQLQIFFYWIHANNQRRYVFTSLEWCQSSQIGLYSIWLFLNYYQETLYMLVGCASAC
jgi:hypothetical protein